MNTTSKTRLRLCAGILLASCLGATSNGWSDCLNGDAANTNCSDLLIVDNTADLRFELKMPTLPGSQLAALPDSVLAFDDLRFQFPENPTSLQMNEPDQTGPQSSQDPWDDPSQAGFALFIGNVARLESDGSLSLGAGRPENKLAKSIRGAGSSDLDVDLGLSYGGDGGFSSSFGFAEKVGNYDADPGVVGQFRYRF